MRLRCWRLSFITSIAGWIGRRLHRRRYILRHFRLSDWRNIINDTASGTFSYVQFYARRIKRLFAAFAVVALFTAAVGWWLLDPYDFWNAGKSLVASTVFLSNVLFYRDAGYFDPASFTKPLLHTWSLGVESSSIYAFPF